MISGHLDLRIKDNEHWIIDWKTVDVENRREVIFFAKVAHYRVRMDPNGYFHGNFGHWDEMTKDPAVRWSRLAIVSRSIDFGRARGLTRFLNCLRSR